MLAMSNALNSNIRNKNFSDEMDQISDDRNDNLNDYAIGGLDEKRVRKAVFRRTIDYNSSVTLFQEQRLYRRVYSSRNALQPDMHYQHLLTPPQDYQDNPMNCVCAKHVRTSTNKNKCPIYTVCWTPDGRRLITAASSGEFTLWNGLTFNFETILQAHDTYIKAMKWSHNEEWLLSGDDLGMVKYWQANMNDVNVFQAHKDAVRGLSFCPSDKKFVTCSVDNTVRIWDFQLCKEERVLRGHGGEVKCVAWHPSKSLVLSGSKDSQQPLKLWDPKAGECISTMYVHKNSCNDIAINKNGNWFLSASKDHTIKLFDLRNLKSEMQVFRGHKKDVFRVAWHPFHENLFASGSGDGALMYWMAGTDMEVGSVDDAHDNIIWSIDWHPMGHILATGSNDFATKFWTRNRPGDVLKDNQQVDHNNMATAKVTEPSQNTDAELENIMKKVKKENRLDELDLQRFSSSIEAEIEKSEKMVSDIPGLSEGMIHDIDIDSGDEDSEEREAKLKGSSYRVIPKQFVLNWADKKKHPAAYVSENNQPVLAPLRDSTPPPIREPPPLNRSPVMRPLVSVNAHNDRNEPFRNQFSAPAINDEQPRFVQKLEDMIIDTPPNRHRIEEMSRFSHPGFQQQRPFMRRRQNYENQNEEFEEQEEEEGNDEEDGEFGNEEDFMERRRPPHQTRNFLLNSFEHQRPPLLHPQPRNFRPENPYRMPHPNPAPGPRSFFQHMSENRYEPPSQFHPQRPHFQRQFHPNNGDSGFEPPNQRFPGLPPPRQFHPHAFGHPIEQPQRPPSLSQHQRQFHPNNADNSFESQRAPPSQRNFIQHNSDNPFEQQQQQQQHPANPRPGALSRNFQPNNNNSENPFEPQKSTGSSKTFIPLPFNDEMANKRGRPHNMGNRPGPRW